MGNTETMLGNLGSGSVIASAASAPYVPISKASAASVCESDAEQLKIEYELSLPIKCFTKYEINCLKDGSDEQEWSIFGIGVLNLLGLFTNTTIDYPEHWFLIAKATNWTKDIDNMISIVRQIILSQKLIATGSRLMSSSNSKKKSSIQNVISFCSKKLTELSEKYFEKLNNLKFIGEYPEFEMICLEKLLLIYLDLMEKKDYKTISQDLNELIKCLEEKETKVYYLIEKNEGYKGITKYNSIDDILEFEKKQYHYNKVRECYTENLKDKTTIKDIDDYIKTLSDSYNLINDNCQTFVRNILDHFT
jgi:hypothetical protein